MDRSVIASDGVRLAVRERGNPAAPTVSCVHGFPDDHSVWDGVADELDSVFHSCTRVPRCATAWPRFRETGSDGCQVVLNRSR